MVEKHILDFEAVVFLENGIGYASDFEMNGLYEVDLKTRKCKYIMFFPNEVITRKRIHCTALYHSSKVFFIPMTGDYISIYDIHKKMMNQILIPSPNVRNSFYKERQKFSKAVYYEGYIYIFPFTYPGILRLDIETNQITILDSWVSEETYFFRGGMCVDGEQVYLVNGVNNIILQFNMATEKSVVHCVGKYNNGSMCISKYGNYYWIVPRMKGAVICWDPVNNRVLHEIIGYPQNFNIDKIVFSKIIFCKKQMFFVPFNANHILSVDVVAGKMLEHENWKMTEGTKTACMFETENHYYFVEIGVNDKTVKRYKVCKTDGRIEKYEFIIENYEQFKKDYFQTFESKGKIIHESEKFKLGDFLSLI